MQLKLWITCLMIGLVGAILFFKDKSTPPSLPSFLKEQISSDLNGVNLSKQALDATWEKVKNLDKLYVRYSANKKTLTAEASAFTKKSKRFHIVTEELEKVLARMLVKEPLDFIVCLEDSLDEQIGPSPIFTFATTKGTRDIILMPDFEAIFKKERHYLRRHILRNNRKIPWEIKENCAFWRGTFTGAMRLPLVALSEKLPELVNAHFVAYVPYRTANFPLYPKMRPKEHLPFKYLIDIDGNSCCYSRTYWVMLANCVMLKQESPNIQWFYRGLEPYVHFVPFAEDVSNLETQIDWCQNHDEACREMAEQATDFALRYLSYETNTHYLYQLLSSYRKKQLAI